VQSRCAVA